MTAPRAIEPTSLETAREVLETTATVAVLGAHIEAQRPACYVPDYLHSVGYEILPVNPALAGQSRWGHGFRGSLHDLPVPVDLVNVFRRPDQLGAHVEDILDMPTRPRCVWFQLGIRNDSVAAALLDGGIAVVIQDRCTLADHKRLGLPNR